MALKITCPHCGTIRRLSQPFPSPGTEVQCDGCGRGLAISYPKGMVDRMREQGVHFLDPYAERPAARPAGPFLADLVALRGDFAPLVAQAQA
ncbi:hypothetical protein L6R53_25405, partial [Myxococcota bacterium]|nr:hypothetical protein [Myxococcota bacterium]